MHALPETGFVKLNIIIGDRRAEPPIPPIYPVSKSAWWQGIRDKRYPAPVRLSSRSVAWRVEDIRKLIELAAPAANDVSGESLGDASSIPGNEPKWKQKLRARAGATKS